MYLMKIYTHILKLFSRNLRKRYILCLLVIVPLIVLLSWSPKAPIGTRPVEGWAPHISRKVRDYVNETSPPLLSPTNFCVQKSFLLVMVCSSPENTEFRKAIRTTWGQKTGLLSVVFLLGQVSEQSLQHKIEEEHRRYNDVLQENFVDTYNNLTIKSINMLKLFKRYCSHSYKFLMKADDDVIVNVGQLTGILLGREQSGVLLGHCRHAGPVFREFFWKWYVPYEWYPNATYPDYLCGPAYVMSNDVANKLYDCALETPIFYLEDVFITGFCRQKLNIMLHHNSGFGCQELKDICHYKNVIVAHYYAPPDIVNLNQLLRTMDIGIECIK